MTRHFPNLDLMSLLPFAENLKSELLGGVIALFVVGLTATCIYYRMKKPKGVSCILCGHKSKLSEI
ncbi:isoflavone reductase protein [Spatholobus suberectus]|nr:isoflavone reductase protein [Spatholobus suberectus]